MEAKRKEYRTRILSEIMNLENSIEADEDMLDNIKHQGTTPFVLAQMDKVENRNNTRIIEVETLNTRLKKLDGGHLDQEISDEIDQEKIDRDSHQAYVANRRLENKELKQAKSKISQDFYKKTAQGDREGRWAVKNMERSYQHFLRTTDSIPSYILRNLEEMPNNKGYIWKGVLCFGELPEEKHRPLTLFERHKGGLLIIHEWTPTEYKVFHKKDKDKKVLQSTQTRRIIQGGTTEESWIQPSLLPEPPPPPPQEKQRGYQGGGKPSYPRGQQGGGKPPYPRGQPGEGKPPYPHGQQGGGKPPYPRGQQGGGKQGTKPSPRNHPPPVEGMKPSPRTPAWGSVVKIPTVA